jgi:acetolactate synthase I/II/III large subunit
MDPVADLIVCRLLGAGVTTLFGVPGGGSNLDVIEAARHAGLRFVLTSTETAGAIAAIAQAEIAGRPGACLTTLGPGVASVVNGVACAKLERAPIVVLTDGPPAVVGGIYEHQRVDHHALLAPVTKMSVTIDSDGAGEAIDRAIACAMAAPRGPVHLDCRVVGSRESVVGGRDRPTTSDTGQRTFDQGLATLLAASHRPLLLVGLGARRQADAVAIRSLCANRRVPAMVTYKAKGVVPDEDPHFAGVFTNGVMERSIIDDADLLIGVGFDPVELIPRPWPYACPIVGCGPWRVDDRHVPFATQLVADIPTAMQEIGDGLRPSDWDLDAVGRTLLAQRDRLCPASHGLAPHRVVQIAARAGANGARVTVDAGAMMFPATTLWPVAEPNQMLISNGLSTMGFAVPAAIGAALLDPGRPVFALIGDGGLLMCAGELLTAVRERLRIIVVVFNDGSLSLIDIKQRQRRYAPSGTSLGNVAWAKLAESFGMASHVASTESEVNRAFEHAALTDGPTLVDARIDPASYVDALRAIRG